jgi:hypothetical protein
MTIEGYISEEFRAYLLKSIKVDCLTTCETMKSWNTIRMAMGRMELRNLFYNLLTALRCLSADVFPVRCG